MHGQNEGEDSLNFYLCILKMSGPFFAVKTFESNWHRLLNYSASICIPSSYKFIFGRKCECAREFAFWQTHYIDYTPLIL